MNHIAKLEKKLVTLRARLAVTTDPDEHAELSEEIDFIQDDIDEMEADEQSYQEMTGTTPQDLYNERNSYAIRQGEMIDQFRNEY